MEILNYINGEWVKPIVNEYVDVINPASGEKMAKTPLCGKDAVAVAAKAATEAFPGWRRTPVQERIQYLFKLRDLLKINSDEIARTITNESGKTFEEARAEMVRAIENVEVACGMPMMAKGEISEDIAPGIDEIMLRQPVGVSATIAPFNFPGMVPFWFLPYALALGNPFIVKPSEKVSMTMQYIFKLIEQANFPKGVVNMVNERKRRWMDREHQPRAVRLSVSM
jgi:malonate-semialdehyde dehydrogenase (acetylating)/methylmalonate-semialdehyde dehydrogenase